MKNKLLTAIYAVAVFFLIITVSISLPIYCRFFYYLQIEPLNIPQITGYDYATIKTAYDQLLNYLTLPGFEFSTGVFEYTLAGKAHFVDCKVLFDLNLAILLTSLTTIICLQALKRKKVFALCRPFGMHISFISSISIFAVIAILIGIISIDFNRAFITFHHLFFPGKDNWQFSAADEIIFALPQQFFMNCAIFIGAGIVVISLSIIIYQLIKRQKTKKKVDF